MPLRTRGRKAFRYTAASLLLLAVTAGCSVQSGTPEMSPSSQSSASPTLSPSATPTSQPTPTRSLAPSTAPTVKPTPTLPSKASSCAQDIGDFKPATVIIRLKKTKKWKAKTVKVPVKGMPLQEGSGMLPDIPVDGSNGDPYRAAAWWNGGSRPGSGIGTAMFMVHTASAPGPTSTSGALGNLLGHRLEDGDMIKVLDSKGRTGACYEVTKIKISKFGQANLDCTKRSSVCSFKSKPARAVFTWCWDSKKQWGQWKKRTYAFAEQIP